MKYLPLIWSGIWRRPGRTCLLLLQVAVAFALLGVLQGMKTGMDQAVAHVQADTLYVGPAVVGGPRLPLADLGRLRAIPGVKSVVFADYLIGNYQRPTQPVYVLGLEKSTAWLTLLPQFVQVSARDLSALQKTRTGALMTADTGKPYGWHVGDRIPLTSTVLQRDGSGTWVFDIVGTFTDHEPGEASFMLANYAYLDESRAQDKGTVRNFFVVVSDPRRAAEVADRIDRELASSATPTQTTSFRELAQMQMKQIGDLSFAIRLIVSAVLVALLFSTCTMMMQTTRERAPDLAVLKILGFTDRGLCLIMLAEALAVCVTAALIGLGLAMAMFPYAGKFVPGLSMPGVVIEAGLAGAVLVALLSVVMPASMAARRPVAGALARL